MVLLGFIVFCLLIMADERKDNRRKSVKKVSMSVDKRIEMNPDGGFSIVFEDKDGSGDLDRIMGDLCKKHREAKLKEQELQHSMTAEEEEVPDLQLDDKDTEQVEECNEL